MEEIVLLTDFSPGGERAFYLALALAVKYRADLDLLHVLDPAARHDWTRFPHVRDTLEAWKMLPQNARQEDVHGKLGVLVSKRDLPHRDVVSGVVGYVEENEPDLMVATSHGRAGLDAWMKGSVAFDAAQKVATPCLLLGPEARSIVAQDTGDIRLGNVLFPVSDAPAPYRARQTYEGLLGADVSKTHYLHVHETDQSAEQVATAIPQVRHVRGDVVSSILTAAEAVDADLIVMPTAGRHGFMDALKGSTTQRVLKRSPCPILAIPA